MLARLMAELDTPMEYHEAMIQAFDTLHRDEFEEEIRTNPNVREAWERFILANPGDSTLDS